MITNKLIHTVNVIRPGLSGTNAFGENEYTETEVYSAIPARVERYQPKIEYKGSGNRPMSKTLVYFDTNVTIEPRDIITAENVPGYSADARIGKVEEVVAAIRGTQTGVHHFEAVLEDQQVNTQS